MSDQEIVDDNNSQDLVDETEVKEKKEKTKALSPMSVDERGAITARDSSEEWRIANVMLHSEAVPKVFKTAEQVMMAMQFLRRFGMDPIICLRQITIINGSLSIWGELPLGICNKSGKIKFMKEWIWDKNYNEICFENKNLDAEVYGATCEIEIVGKDRKKYSFTSGDAKKAGLWDKSVWKLYPKRMLQMRARSWALKDELPEIISGVSILEYDHGTIAENSSGEPLLNLSSTMDKMKSLMNSDSSVTQSHNSDVI